jgi:formylglycine-generating enzyme required for sulfatase activity
MFHHVRVAVIEKTGGDQVPWTEDGIQRRQRVLFGGESKPTVALSPAPVASPRLSEAAEAWDRAKDTTNIAVLDAFVARYKDTFFADLARSRIEELRKQQVAATAQPKTPVPQPAKPAQPAVAVTPAPPPDRCDGVEAQVSNERRCLKPKDSFKDCPDCPEMGVIPAGTFMMGSPVDEAKRDDAEGPQRKVTISRPFAASKFEVTFAEWDACVAAGGCKHKPRDEGWGRGKRPVINVSWDDAKEYVSWLSKKTSRTYRLLTEAEWEYAARAGTTTPFSTGATITTEQANFDGNYTYGGSAKGKYRQRTVEVGSFKPNAFGLHDMHGNVWELVEDCHKSNHEGAPIDGRAVRLSLPSGTICARVPRGGAWNDSPSTARSASRAFRMSDARSNTHGFRVATTLD